MSGDDQRDLGAAAGFQIAVGETDVARESASPWLISGNTAFSRAPCRLGSVSVLFNGYLENQGELARKFAAEGADECELVAKIYLERGLDVALELDGAYSVAILDDSQLHVFTDRSGLEPIYTVASKGNVLVSTSVRGLKPMHRFVLNAAAIPRFFVFGHPQDAATLLQDVRALQHCFILTIDTRGGRCSYTKYDRIASQAFTVNNISDNELEDRCYDILSRRIGRLCDSDSIGTIVNSLSGGVDSSLTQVLLSERGCNRSYCANMQDFGLDGDYSRSVAAALGTDHTVVEVPTGHIGQLVERGIRIAEWPMIFEGEALFQEMYAQVASDHAGESIPPTILDGNGGDTVFGCRKTLMVASMLLRLPHWAIGVVGAAAIGNSKKSRQLRELAPALQTGQFSVRSMFAYWNSLDLLDNYVEMFGSSAVESLADTEISAIAAYDVPLEEALYRLELFDSGTYRTNYVNHALAKSSGVRLVNTFSDPALQAFLMNIPLRRKFKRFREKYHSKRLLQRYLDKPLVYRKKIYKGVPFTKLFREDPVFSTAIEEMRNSTRFQSYWNIDMDRVFSAPGDPLLGKKLINFYIWHRATIG